MVQSIKLAAYLPYKQEALNSTHCSNCNNNVLNSQRARDRDRILSSWVHQTSLICDLQIP